MSPPREAARSWNVTAALLSVQLLFAAHYVASKWLLDSIPAAAWAALRVGGSAAVLALVTHASWRAVRWSGGRLLRIAVLSLFGVVLNQILFLEGLARTVPSHSALINTTIPVTTLLLACLLRKERFTRTKALAMFLALTGVLFLLGGRGLDPGGGTVPGDLLCLANATSFSLFLVLSRDFMRGLPVQTVTTLLFVIGTAGVGAYGGPALLRLDWAAIPSPVWLVGLFIILGPTVGAYFLNNWALARTESSRVALFIYLQFVLAAPLSWMLLGERPSWRLLPAALLVLVGLGLTVFAPSLPGGDAVRSGPPPRRGLRGHR